jgi:hypothetical protein
MFYISEPSASKYPDFARDVSGDPHGITHWMEYLGTDLEIPRSKAAILGGFNSGIA